MKRSILVLSALALMATLALAQQLAPVARLPGSEPKTQGELVFVAKVKTAVSTVASMTYPPRYQYNVEFENPDMIKGDKPEKILLSYTTTDEKPKFLEVGKSVLVNSMNGRITSLAEATDEAIKAAGGKPAATKPAPATAPATQAAAAWTTIGADQQWYKDQEGKEETFTGKLAAVPPQMGMSTLQRSASYTLNGRNLYTGGATIKALDDLVGKKVEMRGKGVTMELEGQSLSEIWPGQIRLAK